MDDLAADDFGKNLPRFSEENFTIYSKALPTLQDLTQAKRCFLAQLALAWLLGQGDDVLAIPARSRKHLEEKLGALAIQLTRDELREITGKLTPSSFSRKRYADDSVFRPE